MGFPRIICTSVIRSAHPGNSHGGCYIVNLNDGRFERVLDWNDNKINWEGRGGDRGLRGIAFYDDNIIIAASNEVFVFNSQFKQKMSIKNPYLRHCHEIFIDNDKLYLSSTGYDSILVYSLSEERFVSGLNVSFKKRGELASRLFSEQFKLKLFAFDPNSTHGPHENDGLHINNVFIDQGCVFFSGTGLNRLYRISKGKIFACAKIPFGTHNVTLRDSQLFYNDTGANRIVHANSIGTVLKSWPIKKYNMSDLKMTDLPSDYARQGFGRGLSFNEGRYLFGGSSPSTISVYDLKKSKMVMALNLTKDIRNSIHGLEILPPDFPY